jgi:putative FmdB family regulatory protein
MPTYEYECLASKKRFEQFQNMTDAPLAKCPECGGPARRLIAAGSAIVVKGSSSHATKQGSLSRSGTSCGHSRPCCGREVPCESRPCDR